MRNANFDLISRNELLELCSNQGLTDAEIAQLYGVTANKVNEKRRKMNLVAGQLSSEQMKQIVLMAERIKTLPLDAIEEIQSIVERYA